MGDTRRNGAPPARSRREDSTGSGVATPRRADIGAPIGRTSLARAAAQGALAALSLLAATACSKSDHAPATALVFGDSATTFGDDASPAMGDDASAADATPVTDAAVDSSQPMPDVVVVDGPSVPPPPDNGPLTWCSADGLTLSGTALRPSSTMPAAFASAWSAEAAKTPQGVLLLRLSGLTSNPQKVSLSIGTPDPSNPTQFYPKLVPASAGAGVDATTHAFGAQATSPVGLVFETGASATTILASAWMVSGSLTSKCDGATSVIVTLKVATDQGSKTLNGSALSSLLGDPDTAVNGKQAWTITLSGATATVGG